MLDMAHRNLHRTGTAEHFFKWGEGVTSDFNGEGGWRDSSFSNVQASSREQ